MSIHNLFVYGTLNGGTLAALDRLEALRTPGNTRAVLDVMSADEPTHVSAWAYFKSRHLAAPIHTTYLDSYEDDRFTGPQTEVALPNSYFSTPREALTIG